jgi:hypothetical protein
MLRWTRCQLLCCMPTQAHHGRLVQGRGVAKVFYIAVWGSMPLCRANTKPHKAHHAAPLAFACACGCCCVKCSPSLAPSGAAALKP